MGQQNAEFVMNHVAWMLDLIENPTMSSGRCLFGRADKAIQSPNTDTP
jgi:hypothetical protein